MLLGAVLICFVGSVYLATAASRSIARPLATLAAEANRLAGERLPEAVRRATAGDADTPPPTVAGPGRRQRRDPAGRQRAGPGAGHRATALATEQAMLRRSTTESLANLGRRNQNLLRRQLGFITSLEREESDPTGAGQPVRARPPGHPHAAQRGEPAGAGRRGQPAAMVGAAADRRRDPRRGRPRWRSTGGSSLRRIDDALVAGAVVSGVAHMLAELVENGLAFSPPDVDVEIQGRWIGDSYLIAITDQGVGMNRADLERANPGCAATSDFLTAPTRFLGHYVVGRLASDMDIERAAGAVAGHRGDRPDRAAAVAAGRSAGRRRRRPVPVAQPTARPGAGTGAGGVRPGDDPGADPAAQRAAAAGAAAPTAASGRPRSST